MAIHIPGSAFQGISPLGARPPEAGFYEVSVVELSNPNNKPGKRRIHVQFVNGFRMFDFMNLPYDDNGNAMPGLSERQVRGQLAAVRSILESLGYTGGDIEAAAAITDDWFLTSANSGRKAYIEFVPGQQGVQGSYNTIVRWMSKAQYDVLCTNGATVTASPAAAKQAVTSAPVPTAAAPSNGAPAPSVQATLPPPPSAAQGITN